MKPEDRARALFVRAFGRDPAAVASAPGRVNLIGEHVDYHGGHVLPLATHLRTAVAVGPTGGGFRAVSESRGASDRGWPATRGGDWSDYVAGVAHLYDPGDSPWSRGLAVAVAGDVPLGAGLSSSAALEVAAAYALARWAGRPLTPDAAADLAWRAETSFVGMPCGRMDQIASARAPAGEALMLDCRTLESRSVPVTLDLVVADSGEPHALRESGYAQRRREGDEALARLRALVPSLECLVDIPPARLPMLTRELAPNLAKRVRHVVNENQRAVLAARALDAGDHAGFGTLVSQSHDSLRDLYECSTPRLDALVTAARAIPGVLGARLVGAGWGGSVLVVAERGQGAHVAGRLPAARVVRPGAGAAAD